MRISAALNLVFEDVINLEKTRRSGEPFNY